MSDKFQPSPLSGSKATRQRTNAQLMLVNKVVVGIAERMKEEEPPSWVLSRLQRAAQELALVQSYLEQPKSRSKA